MSPSRLNEASLHSARSGTILPTYDRSATRFCIVHIGPGAFHRAHQAFYVDTLLHSDKRWAISALSLKSTTLRDALGPQQGLDPILVASLFTMDHAWSRCRLSAQAASRLGS